MVINDKSVMIKKKKKPVGVPRFPPPKKDDSNRNAWSRQRGDTDDNNSEK
jgi:hypothetical protein